METTAMTVTSLMADVSTVFAKAIEMVKGKPKIARKPCIRCFCCQEFCPKSAMKVKRTWLASIFHREKKK